MKTSKLLLTSLLAAATMGTSAYAGFVWNGGENITQALWQTESSWRLTDGTTWPTDPRAAGPLTPNSNAWNGVTVANASGTVGTFEGWALGLTLQNANLTVTNLNKFQTTDGSGCTINLDKTSTLSMTLTDNGRLQDNVTVNTEGVFNLALGRTYNGGGFIANLGNGGVMNFTSTGNAFTTKVSRLNATLNTTDFDSYTIDANGNTVYTRNLIRLGDNVSFDTNTTTTVTMTPGAGVGTLTRVEEGDISGTAAGSYKVTKGPSGYSVSYVVAGTTYAWNATAADSVWDTSTRNWTKDGGSTSVAFADGGNVFFGAGETLAKIVAIDSAVRVGTISVADDYTFNVGASGSLSETTAVAVAGTKTATLNLASNMELSANLGGSGTLKKTGTGLLTYSGTISSGATLEIAEGGTTAAPNVFSGTLSQGATLNISGGVTKIPGGDPLGNGPIRGDLTIGVGAVAIGTGTDAIPWGNNLAQIIRVLGTLQLDARWSMNSEKKIVLSGGTITGTGREDDRQTVSLDYFGNGTIATEVGATRSQISAHMRVVGRLTFDAAADLSVSGNILNRRDGVNSEVVKQGAGTLTLSGTNTYRSLEISAGKLVAASEGALGTGAVTVNGDGSILDFAVSGGTFTQNKDTNQALTTTNGGKITVSAGTLALTGAVNLSNAIEVANGANLTTTGDVLFSLANLTGTTNGNVTTYSLVSLLGESQTLGTNWTGLGETNINISGTSIAARDWSASFVNDGSVVITSNAGELTWVGDENGAGTWDYAADNKPWTMGGADTAFVYNDNVTFAKDATVAIAAAGVTAGTVTIASGKTVTLSGGNVTAQSGFELESGATLSLGAGNANGATATLADKSVYAIDASAASSEISLANVTGGVDSTIEIKAYTSPAFTTISGMSSGFSGTLKVTGGFLNLSNPSIVNGSNVKEVVISGGIGDSSTTGSGLCFMGVSGLTFSKNIVAEGEGGVLRSYALASYSVEFTGSVTGTTIRHSDGGTHKFLGTVDLQKFVQSGATGDQTITEFAGTTTLGTLEQTLGTTKFTGGTANVGTMAISGGALNISGGTVSATTLNISGGTTTISGGTTIATNGTTVGNGGVLVLGASGAASHLQGVLTINNGGTVKLTGGDATGYGNDAGTDATNVIYKLVINKGGVLEIGTDATQSNQNQTFNMKDGVVLQGGQITAKNGVSNAKFDLFNTNTTTAGVTALASDTTAVISADICLRNKGSFDVASGMTADGVDLLVSGRLTSRAQFTVGKIWGTALTKSGAGTMKLTGDNQYWTSGGSVTEGTLIAASTTALGKGGTISVSTNATLGFVAGTTVDMLKTTTTNGVTTTTNGAIQLANGAKIVVDMLGQDANQEGIVLDLVSGVALSYNGVTVTADNVDTLLGSAISLKNWGEGWTQSLSYADNTLSLTLTIPEPSTFGLLAGLGALALAGTRRRRKKA